MDDSRRVRRNPLASPDGVAVGTWVTVGHPQVAELLAGFGFDFAILEAEHAPNSLATVENLVRAVEAASGDVRPLVRVASADETTLKRVLDTGPAGVIVPMVDTPAAAERVVEATRYPPAGVRGLGSSRATDYGRDLPEYVERANRALVRVVQIESGRAVENAAAIAAVEGIDGVFVGPTDLSLSLGAFGERDDARLGEAVTRVVDAAHAAGTLVGTVAAGSEQIRARLDWDVDFLAAGVDTAHLRAGARDSLRAVGRHRGDRGDERDGRGADDA